MTKPFIEIPNDKNSMCFACGPVNNAGLKMKFYGNDDLVYSEIAVPGRFIGWQNVVHGGILSTLLDEVMGWGAIFLTRRFILTRTMTVSYLKPVITNDKLRVESCIESQNGERECIMNGKIFNSKGELCTTSTGSFGIFTYESMKKTGILSEKDMNDFQSVILSHI